MDDASRALRCAFQEAASYARLALTAYFGALVDVHPDLAANYVARKVNPIRAVQRDSQPLAFHSAGVDGDDSSGLATFLTHLSKNNFVIKMPPHTNVHGCTAAPRPAPP